MRRIDTRCDGLNFDWLCEMKAELDKLDRLLRPTFDNPAIAEQDRLNEVPDPPDPEDDATGSSR